MFNSTKGAEGGRPRDNRQEYARTSVLKLEADGLILSRAGDSACIKGKREVAPQKREGGRVKERLGARHLPEHFRRQSLKSLNLVKMLNPSLAGEGR